ncbi:RHS repeat domain-containing protein [Flavobacterium sp.]|uniref:RHS repeat domain-containing protein n=1 Tax=Flavobacterium sp. TaxID=239 RepID=UPI0035B4CD81
MGAANKLYNGNIAETFWSTATDGGFVRNYGYKYDNLNRLKDATYQKSGQVTGMYNENLSYDKNGNIMNLSRYGDRDEQYLPIQIDNLQYGYATNSNKLLSVADNSNNTSGFKDGNTTGNDYLYDVNGNMTVDKNKNITAITYNHLNLPTQITFGNNGNIVYIYTASGQKVKKVVTSTTPASVVTTDYLGGYQYSNTSLQLFSTAEGYVKNTLVSGTNSYSYVFNYTDHLGNTRLSYTKDTTTGSLKILEESNYYPFGLKHNSYNVDNYQPDYKYKYNGKELQDELGLNMTAMDYRQYDNTLGRFNSIDVLSELAYSITPYRFAYNNPVFFSDPTGLYEVNGKGDITITDKKEIQKFAEYLKNNQKASLNEMAEHIFNAENGFAYQLTEIVIQIGSKKSQNNFYDNIIGQIGESQKKIQSFEGTIYSNNQKYDDEGIPNSVHAGAVGFASTVGDAVMRARFRETFKAMQTENLSTSFTKTLKTTGKVFQVAGAAASLYTYYQSDGSGADKARLAGAAIITGSAFIPVVGPILSVGLGVLDSVGAFDGVYNKFD